MAKRESIDRASEECNHLDTCKKLERFYPILLSSKRPPAPLFSGNGLQLAHWPMVSGRVCVCVRRGGRRIGNVKRRPIRGCRTCCALSDICCLCRRDASRPGATCGRRRRAGRGLEHVRAHTVPSPCGHAFRVPLSLSLARRRRRLMCGPRQAAVASGGGRGRGEDTLANTV